MSIGRRGVIENVRFYVNEREREILLVPDFVDDMFPITISKFKVYRHFLGQEENYFSIKDVCELLGLQRNSVHKLMKEGLLDTYEVVFEDGLDSNVKKVIHIVDLIVCLKQIRTKAFERYTTYSRYEKPRGKDYLGRSNNFTKDRVFYILENQMNKEKFDNLCHDIATGRVKLYSKHDLKEMTGRSDATIYRLMKCLPSIHFQISPGQERESTRVFLPVTVNPADKDFSRKLEDCYRFALDEIIYSLSSSFTALIPLELESDSIKFVDYQEVGEAGDFVGLHLFEDCPAPDLLVDVKGDLFFGVSKEKMEQEGYSQSYNIKEIQWRKQKDAIERAEELRNLFMPKSYPF